VAMSSWLVLGSALLLALAAVARVLGWDLVAVGSRAGAAAVLVAALILSILNNGGWSPFVLGQLSLCLALAMLLSDLVLVWRLGVDGASPVVDVLALFVLFMGVWVVGFDAPALTCSQQSPPFYAQWVLFLFGVGAVLVSGSAGLLLYLRVLLVRGGWAGGLPPGHDLQAFLRHSSALALVALGAGLTVGVWWAWQEMGSLYGGDPREIWMASTWLASVMSLLSWQIGKRSGLWAAGLAIVAAIIGLVGLLI